MIPTTNTEIFTGHAVCNIADLAFTQIKRVYMVHGAIQRLGGKHGSHPAVQELR